MNENNREEARRLLDKRLHESLYPTAPKAVQDKEVAYRVQMMNRGKPLEQIVNAHTMKTATPEQMKAVNYFIAEELEIQSKVNKTLRPSDEKIDSLMRKALAYADLGKVEAEYKEEVKNPEKAKAKRRQRENLAKGHPDTDTMINMLYSDYEQAFFNKIGSWTFDFGNSNSPVSSPLMHKWRRDHKSNS